MTVFGLEDADLVKVDTSLTRCTVDNWQRRVSIYNVADATGSAADVASTQVRTSTEVCGLLIYTGVRVDALIE